jgi:hypothetical protein
MATAAHAGSGATVAVTVHWQDGGVQIAVSDGGGFEVRAWLPVGTREEVPA